MSDPVAREMCRGGGLGKFEAIVRWERGRNQKLMEKDLLVRGKE